MFATIRKYHGQPGAIAEVGRRFQTELLPQLSRMPGFVSYNLIHAPDDVGIVVQMFQDRATGEAANKIAVEWARQNVAALAGTPEVTMGDVIVSSAPKG
jgi:heme-degrading monooxygenase HmoA